MKEELAAKLHEYLSRENAYITQEDARLLDEARSYDADARSLAERADEMRKKRGGAVPGASEVEVNALESKLSSARQEAARLERELGRAEGALEANTVIVEQIVPVPHVRQFIREIEVEIAQAEQSDDIGSIRSGLEAVRNKIKSFIDGLTGNAPETSEEARQHVESLAHQLK